jgi:uncharacterized protein (TIGR03067 family)
MRIRVLLVAAATCSISAAPAGEEMKGFQGRWVPTYVEIAGKPIPQEGLDDLREIEIEVKGDRVLLKEDGQVKEGWTVTCKVDPTRTPRWIDLSVSVEGSRPMTYRGIYRMEGDTLQISILPPGKEGERPTAFATTPTSQNRLWHFKRR